MMKHFDLARELSPLDKALSDGMVLKLNLESRHGFPNLGIDQYTSRVVIGKVSHGILIPEIEAEDFIPSLALVRSAHYLNHNSNGLHHQNRPRIKADGLVGLSLRMGAQLVARKIRDGSEDYIAVELVGNSLEVKPFDEFDRYFARPTKAKHFATAYGTLQRSLPMGTSPNNIFNFRYETLFR